MSKKELAPKRNWFKHQIASYSYPIDMNILTTHEKMLWEDLQRIRNELLDQFDYNSRLLGLNVPKHKCFEPNCRNKVIAVEINPIPGIKTHYVCKKHFELVKNTFKLLENENNN